MPTVLRVGAFSVRLYLPPREHGAPHVHVWKAGARVEILLDDPDRGPSVRRVRSMNARDVDRALRLVESHREFLLDCWRKYHG